MYIYIYTNFPQLVSAIRLFSEECVKSVKVTYFTSIKCSLSKEISAHSAENTIMSSFLIKMNLACWLKLLLLVVWSVDLLAVLFVCLRLFGWLFNLRLKWVSDLPTHWILKYWDIKKLLLQSRLFIEDVVRCFSNIACKTVWMYNLFVFNTNLRFRKRLVEKPILFFEFFCALLFTIFLHLSKSWKFYILTQKLVSVKKCLQSLYLCEGKGM